MLYLSFEGSRPSGGSSRHSLLNVDEVHLGRGTERSWQRTSQNGRRLLKITIPDSWMSTNHARLLLDKEGVRLEDLGSKNGSSVNGCATQEASLVSGDLIELGSTFLKYVLIEDCDVREAVTLDVTPSTEEAAGMATLLPSFRQQTSQLKKIARSVASVIVHGESGTGKELIARAIHDSSGRSGPFVAVNCAAITETLLESELFGHRKGAFSGAIGDRQGLIESSSGGTLFLDEIGELSAKGQAALLRVLEQREVTPVGANRPTSVDLRIVAATHRALLSDVGQGSFREDLYARLSTFVVTLPSLRERKAEMGSIIASLLARNPANLDKLCFAPAAARALLQYDWPRNIRELEKCLTSAVVLADAGRIETEHLSELIRSAIVPSDAAQHSEDERLRSQLTLLLGEHKGNVTHVGNALGKKRQQIQKWCKRLGIDPKQFR
jgi:transcriptional regulator with PAS, ATPase and Fis domain